MINFFHTDCMDFMRTKPDKFYDLCVTDPPYGVGLKYGTYDDSLDNWHDLMNRFIPEVQRVCKMVIFPSCSINKLAWIYINYPPDWLICWHKGSPGHAAYIGFNDFEPLLVYGKLKGLQMHDYFSLANTEKMGNYGHPCPKPVKWYKKLYSMVNNSVKINTVIEPFAGSGTASLAINDLGVQQFDACELDKEYFDAGKLRYDNYKKQLKLF